ncbi:O-antigen ligase domain-containing protein [Patescibacteria group bacterium]|nr:MAG: O-antigen ligase domain-containing protein [Patescibacteria group bacterium]
MRSYLGLAILIFLASAAAAVLGLWALLAILAAGIFWFLTEIPLVGIVALLLGIIAGQIIRIPIGAGTIVISDLILFAVIFAWAFKKLINRELFFIKNLINLPLIILDVIMALSLIWALVILPRDEVVSGSLYFFRFLAYQMILFFVQTSIKNAKQAKQIFYLSISAGVVLSILGFIQLMIFPDFSSMVPEGWDPHIGRLLSTWFDPNLLGGLFAFLALLIISQMLFEKIKFWHIASLCIFITALLLTFSRSSLVAFVFGFFIIIMMTIKRSWWMLGLGIGILIIAFLASPRIQERVEGILTIDVTAQKRVESWNNVLVLVRDNPLFGTGFNTLRYVQFEEGLITNPEEHSAGGSDSSFLTILATTGIFGLLAFLWLWFSALFVSWKLFINKENKFNSALGLGIIGGLASLIVHSQFVNSLLYPHMLVIVWILLGVAVLIHNKQTQIIVKSAKYKVQNYNSK